MVVHQGRNYVYSKPSEPNLCPLQQTRFLRPSAPVNVIIMMMKKQKLLAMWIEKSLFFCQYKQTLLMTHFT